MSLFRELIEECTKCSMLRKKFVETSMGKLADEQMMIAPPFLVTMVDIYGPCLVYVPGHSMALRNRKVEEAKVYVVCFVCPTTKLCMEFILMDPLKVLRMGTEATRWLSNLVILGPTISLITRKYQ